MQNDKLLNCPFCAGEAKIDITGDGGYRVTCKRILGCGCKFEWFDSEDEAIASWNTRKPMERIVESLEEVSFERYGNQGMGGELVVNLDDAIDIVKGGVDNAG